MGIFQAHKTTVYDPADFRLTVRMISQRYFSYNEQQRGGATAFELVEFHSREGRLSKKRNRLKKRSFLSRSIRE